MAAYCRVYDSCHLQADCQEPESALEPYARQSSMGYLYLVCVDSNALVALVELVDNDSRKTERAVCVDSNVLIAMCL